ncbi:hypothetical protein SNEBB_005346 [Seison nebaliae]|nr:hypothetical protein SNEBB_005346 [Seison nebaliae]
MSSNLYEIANHRLGSKLKLKDGSLKKIKKTKKKKSKIIDEDNLTTSLVHGSLKEIEESRKRDEMLHAGWWSINNMREINYADVVIEMGGPHSLTYVSALDDGLLTVGSSHTFPHIDEEHSQPKEEEIFSLTKINDVEFALKSGFNKYLSINVNGLVVGRKDAIDRTCYWKLVWEEEDNAIICGSNDKYLAMNSEGFMVCLSATADSSIFSLRLRTKAQRIKDISHLKWKEREQLQLEEEETAQSNLSKKTLAELEKQNIMKFQCWGGEKKIKVNPNDIKELKTATKTGNIHETLLDRRAAMKSDKFCK